MVEPVRSIIGAGQRLQRGRPLRGAGRSCAPGQQAAADVERHRRPAGADRADALHDRADAGRPVALNRNLGTYTNFVNLLDYAAIAVPSRYRADGLPFGITLIGPCGSDWQLAELGAAHTTTRPGCARARPASRCRRAERVAGLIAPAPMRQGRRGRRASVGHAAERAVDGARRRLLARPTHRAALPALRAARHRPAQARPAARAARRGRGDRARGLGDAVAQLRLVRRAIPPPLGIGTLELADGSACRASCASRRRRPAPRTSRTSAAGAPRYVTRRDSPPDPPSTIPLCHLDLRRRTP